jgi:LPS-assembly protein
MKNSILISLVFLLYSNISFAENLEITAKNILVDKKTKITIFRENVIIKDDDNNEIRSNYAEYDKNKKYLILKDNVIATDSLGNIFKSNFATYDEQPKIFKSKGKSSILTKDGYKVNSSDILLDNLNNYVLSKKPTYIEDVQKNNIYLDNFEYQTDINIFKSVGKIEVIDELNNSYKFSQIYIDEKKKEIIGTDAKTYFKHPSFKFNENNKPRMFSNTVNIKDGKSKFIKSNFTMCNYRKNDKCPPWQLNASQITHDKKRKTIFYDNAVIKIYNVPVLYLPRLAHPDPTVKRRSGFLNPSFSDTKNLGASINLPYFWAINGDKDLTLNNRLFINEHPLILGEYRHAFKNSNLIFDFGYTQGYKNTSTTKKAGEKSHFFSKFVKEFQTDDSTENNLEVDLQYASNKKYLKLYKVDSNLVNYETEVLENNIDFKRFNNEENSFFGVKASNYRTLKESYENKYENILPEIIFDKNIFSENLGYGNFQTNFKVHNYDTNKYKNFLINDFEWSFNNFSNYNYDGKFLTKFKNVNYEVKNEDEFKSDTTNELFGALGYLASIDLYKRENKYTQHLLKPKVLFRYSPNHMRKDKGNYNLSGKDIFSLNRLDSKENFESGTNISVGFDYEKDSLDNNLKFSIGQIINEKKNNKNMSDSSSLDNRFSDVVGNFNFNNKNFNLNYNYALDQNFENLNYNDIETSYKLNNVSFKLNYFEENKTVSEKEYLKTGIEITSGENNLFSFTNKRNLVTNSSEFYNLSYEYLNDCLRAGIVYRREFYNDSELEPENSLMFKITLNSFGELTSPSFSQ